MVNMKKRLLLPIAGAVGASVAGYLYNKSKKQDADNNSTFENAGAPDQSEATDLAQLENAKMVSDGSQFGVQYYTKHKANDGEEQYS